MNEQQKIRLENYKTIDHYALLTIVDHLTSGIISVIMGSST